MAEDRQRIDKWLWHARVVRTRSAAAALAASGLVRVNGQRIDAASRPVRLGDVVTVALDRTVRLLKVAGFADRRGGAEAARALFEDVTAAAPAQPVPPGAERSAAERLVAEEPPAQRHPGTGRPTKRERRALDRLRGPDDTD
jgi:ribosome-associated heat shock protein Hsp15